MAGPCGGLLSGATPGNGILVPNLVSLHPFFTTPYPVRRFLDARPLAGDEQKDDPRHHQNHAQYLQPPRLFPEQEYRGGEGEQQFDLP
jgi:hypothetical protein